MKASEVNREVSHFLLTSFSVRHASLDQTRVRGRAIGGLPSSSWLRERIELFETFCLPSVDGQSCNDFTWLVFIAEQNPPWLAKSLESLALPNMEIIPIYGTLYGKELVAPIRSRCASDTVLTTRLDNDDALEREHIRKLRQATQAGLGIYTFPRGIQLMPWGVTRIKNVFNPFISLLERIEDVVAPEIETALQVRHDLNPEHHDVHAVKSGPAWMQVIHGSNLGNKPSGIPGFTRRYRKNFPIPTDIPNLRLRAYSREIKPLRKLLRKASNSLTASEPST